MHGSSPRMRGTHHAEHHAVQPPRFIPAYAGNAPRSRTYPFGIPVHPRVCGERDCARALAPQLAGSSPRMRGTPDCDRPQLAKGRFIPAYAGNAFRKVKYFCFQSVHPRVCGERSRQTCKVQSLAGSSPRMRGTLKGIVRQRSEERFIPAYAGNALTPSSAPLKSTVHPRVCGERFFQTVKV